MATCCTRTTAPVRSHYLPALLRPERARPNSLALSRRSEDERKVVERDPNSIMDRHVGGQRVVPAAQVLHERMPGADGARRPDV